MAIHPFVLHNGEIRMNTASQLAPGQVGLLAGWGVFSTLRVIDGHLFAWDRHWARMTRDARLMNIPLPNDPVQLEADLMRLAEANRAPNCTLRIVVVRNGGGMWEGPCDGRSCDSVALTADLKEWGESVSLGVQSNARFAANEFAGAKILSWAQNLTWAERASERGFDEVLLLNEHGRVAECTSANVFALFGEKIVTPSLSEGCLPGVTREILIELEPEIEQLTLTIDDLYAADDVFITSTTRGLLPVREIEGRRLGMKGKTRKRLALLFSDYQAKDIGRRKELGVAS